MEGELLGFGRGGGGRGKKGDDAQLARVDPYAVGVHLGAQPFGKNFGGFDEEEFAVAVEDADP